MKKVICLLGLLLAFNHSFSQTLQTITSNGNSTSTNIEILNGAFLNVNSGNISVGDAKISLNAFGNHLNGGYAVIQPSYHSVGYNIPLVLNSQGGNVGIGKTSPAYKLDVNGNILANGNLMSSIEQDEGGQIMLVNPKKSANGAASVWRIMNMTGSYGNSLQFWAYDNAGCGSGLCGNRFTLMDNGDVKMGDANTFHGSVFQTNNYSTMVFRSRAWRDIQGPNGKAFSFQTHNNGGIGEFEMMGIYYGENGKITMVPNGGNVGIGTENPGSYKLAVEGTIGARKIKVTGEIPWADYVFDSSYQLAPLSHVETFIKENKHLPEVPSAAEVKKDGLDLGDNQAVLLKKIEELTLYIIQQNKELVDVKKRLSEIETRH